MYICEAQRDKTAPMSDILEIETIVEVITFRLEIVFLSNFSSNYGIVYYCGTGV